MAIVRFLVVAVVGACASLILASAHAAAAAPAADGGGAASRSAGAEDRRRRQSTNLFLRTNAAAAAAAVANDGYDDEAKCCGVADPVPGTFCGRGPDRKDCEENTQYCHVHPADEFAVCCPGEEKPPKCGGGSGSVDADSNQQQTEKAATGRKRVARCLRKKRREGKKYLSCGLQYTRANYPEDDADDDKTKMSKKGDDDNDNDKDRMRECGNKISGAGVSSAFASSGKRFRRKGRCIEGGVTAETMDQVLDLCLATGLGGKDCKAFGKQFVDKSAGRRFDLSNVETATTTTTTATAPSEPEIDVDTGAGAINARMAMGMSAWVPWHVNAFDADVVEGYTECQSFEADLEQAFRMLADSVICGHVKEWDDRRTKRYRGDDVFTFGEGFPMEMETTEIDPPPEGESEGEDSYKTNVQEEGVDEGDVLKVREDGKVVFAAYGDLLLCWDADSGDMTCRMKMPATKKLDGEPKGSNWHSNISNEATILSLLIHESTLVVIVDTGYRGHWCWYCWHPIMEGGGSNDDDEMRSLLSDHAAVQIRMYDISDDGIPGAEAVTAADPDDDEGEGAISTTGLPLLGTSLLQGYPMAYRSVGKAAHIVTSSDVQTHLFTTELSPWNKRYFDAQDNATAYALMAAARAEELVPKFASKLAEEVLGVGGECSDSVEVSIAKISSFGMASTSNETSCGGSAEDNFLSNTGLLNKFVRVNSFDMTAAPSIPPETGEENEDGDEDEDEDEEPQWDVSVAGSFLPTYWAETYASQKTLVLGGRLYRRVGGPWPFGTYEDATFLLAFELSSDGSAAKGIGAGTAPGYTLNRFAFDEQDGYLRVATTTSQKTTCGTYKNHTYDWCVEYEKSEEIMEGDVIYLPGKCVAWANHTYQWCSEWITLSNSTSQITVLKLPMTEAEKVETGGLMPVVANVTDLGPTEVIFAVRFFPTRAFVVTFQITDPLYSIDFADNENPVPADALKITGFGRYLHPVPMDDEDYLLAVGQEADNTTGRPTGLQVSLFNVTDLYDISLLTRYSIDSSSKSARSSSAAEFDPHAFRYLPRSRWLLLPTRVRDYENPEGAFDGFAVFDVAPDKIGQKFNVSMADPSYIAGGGCYYRANMPPRTLVFKGDATFVKSHSYRSIDLETEDPRWDKSLDEHIAEEDCKPCYWCGG